MKYQLSAKARVDLIRIWEYTAAKWSLDQADSYYQDIVAKFLVICTNPNIGKSYDELRSGYRGLPVQSHIIFYRYQDQSTIEIIRILHQRMDYLNKL